MRSPAGRGARFRAVLLVTFTVAGALFIVAPLLVIVLNSFNSAAFSPFPPPGFSLEWYRNLFGGSGGFGPAAIFTIQLACLSTALAVVAGVLAAYALERRRVPGATALRGSLLMPIVLPKMVLGVGLFIFFTKINVYGQIWSLVVAHALISLPFVFVLTSAALVGVDRSQEEAARDLGASWLRTFVTVVFPQIRAAVVVSVLFGFIVSADQLESTIFLTRPGHETLPVAMFNYTLQYQDPTTAALSTVIIAASLLLVVLSGVVLRRGNVMALLSRTERGGTR